MLLEGDGLGGVEQLPWAVLEECEWLLPPAPGDDPYLLCRRL